MATILPHIPEREGLKRYSAQVMYANTRDQTKGRGILEYWILWRIDYTDLTATADAQTFDCTGVPPNSRIQEIMFEVTETFAGPTNPDVDKIDFIGDSTVTIFIDTDIATLDEQGPLYMTVDPVTPIARFKSTLPGELQIVLDASDALEWTAGSLILGIRVIGYHDE